MGRRKPRTIRKRSFLLLELLISLALVACCLFPLIKPHVFIHKKEREALEKMQLEMQAERAFCELKRQLYEQKISWKQLAKGVSGELGSVEVFAGGKDGCPFTCTYVLDVPKGGTGYKLKPKRDVCILNVEFIFKPKKGTSMCFHRTLFVEQMPQEAAG